MPRRRHPWASVVLAVALAAGGCTGDRGPGPRTTGGRETPEPRPGVEIAGVLGVVAADGDAAQPYLDGMELARRHLEAKGRSLRVIRREPDASGAARALRSLLRRRDVAAVLVVGSGSEVSAARPAIEAAGRPVVLLGGDLYTPRRLFRWVFQTSPPIRWQAQILARYLGVDRRYRRVAVGVEPGPHAAGHASAIEEALGEEGIRPDVALILRDPAIDRLKRAAEDVDALVVAGGAAVTARVTRMLQGLDDPPQLAAFAPGLTRAMAAETRPPPGTVAPYAYTWAGWAEPIRRVATFRARFRRAFGRLPGAFEQEGYDAVRVVGDALADAGGRSGEPLLRRLERTTDAAHSSLPVRLGPDDHVFADDLQMGLFAVAGDDDDAEPWSPDWAPWRPVMRTFTYDGRRTAILDRDKPIFFPHWHERRPSPFYWRSRYGITSRPRRDPVH